MAGQKISQLSSLSGQSVATGDYWPMVDVSDTSMGASGTTKAMTTDQAAIALVGQVIDKDVLDYVARIKAVGGDIDSKTVCLFSELVFQAKRDGWYNSVLEWYPMLGSGLTSALVKFKYISASSSLTNENLVAADYSQERGIGPMSGNTNKRLRTNFTPGTYGYSQTNFGFIASIVGQTTANAASSGPTIGDLTAGTSGECSVYLKHHINNVVVGNGTYAGFQSLNSSNKTISFQSSGSRHQTCVDGVQFTDWAQTTTGSLSGEMCLFSGISQNSTRYQNGILGNVLFTSYMTESLAKLATAAISRFERIVRSSYCYGESGCILWGDSITATQGASTYRLSFGELFARGLGLSTRNLGVPSQWLTASSGPIGTSGQLSDVANLPERTVVNMFGSNDGQYGVTTGTYYSTLSTNMRSLAASGKRPIICSPSFSTNASFTTGIQRGYALMAANVAVEVTGIFSDNNRAIGDQLNTGAFLADSIHPNTSGHFVMANRMLTAVNGIQERTLLMDFGSLVSGSTETQNVEILTARVGQRSNVIPPTGSENGIFYNSWVSADNTVSVKAYNSTAGTINPVSGMYTVQVFSRI